MNHYSNPTANAAIGAIDRELKMMRKRAKYLKARKEAGLLTPAEVACARKQFVGIYRHILRDALAECPQTEKAVTSG